MPKANPKITIPDRRFALRLAATATASGLMTPVAALAGAGADAELIRLCGRVRSLWVETEALHAVWRTLADEARTEPTLERLYRETESALTRIDDIGGPITLAGARTMAEASLAIAPRDSAGDLLFQGNAEWLAFCVAAFLVERISV